MPDTVIENRSSQEALKKLKASRREQIAAAAARLKEQRRAVQAVKECLQDSELTVPEIAAAAGLPVSEALWYVATMKRYGEILEGPKAGAYFRYRLNPAAVADPEPKAQDQAS